MASENPTPPFPTATAVPPTQAAPAVPVQGRSARVRAWLGRCGRAVLCALERAEQCITEHFKVPPNGG